MDEFIKPIRKDYNKLKINKTKVAETTFDNSKIISGLCAENTNGFFEIIQGKLRGIDLDNLQDTFIDLTDIPIPELFPCKINRLGEYNSNKKEIKYYDPSPFDEVVKIHERYHAIHHLTPDRKRQIWNRFINVSPFYKELLAQLFTYIYCRDIERNYLDDFFELNRRQSVLYKTWKFFQHYDFKDAIKLYWNIRKHCLLRKTMGILSQIEFVFDQGYLHHYFILNTNYNNNKLNHYDMLYNEKAAAYDKRRKTIRRINKKDIIFLYQSGKGIIAYGKADGIIRRSYQDCIGQPAEEYHTSLSSFVRVSPPVDAAEIKRATKTNYQFNKTLFWIPPFHGIKLKNLMQGRITTKKDYEICLANRLVTKFDRRYSVGGLLICGLTYGLRKVEEKYPEKYRVARSSYFSDDTVPGLSSPYRTKILNWFEYWGHPLSRPPNSPGRFEQSITVGNWIPISSHDISKISLDDFIRKSDYFIDLLNIVRPRIIFFMGASTLVNLFRHKSIKDQLCSILGPVTKDIRYHQRDVIKKDGKHHRKYIVYELHHESAIIFGFPHPTGTRPNIQKAYIKAFKDLINPHLIKYKKDLGINTK